MCSRMCDNPAPNRSSSSVLPVAHHACTLATGALRSSWTISVNPLGNVHFWAELGGKVMAGWSLLDAACRFEVLNMVAMSKATNDEARMTKPEQRVHFDTLDIRISFVIRHSSFVI